MPKTTKDPRVTRRHVERWLALECVNEARALADMATDVHCVRERQVKQAGRARAIAELLSTFLHGGDR